MEAPVCSQYVVDREEIQLPQVLLPMTSPVSTATDNTMGNIPTVHPLLHTLGIVETASF